MHTPKSALQNQFSSSTKDSKRFLFLFLGLLMEKPEKKRVRHYGLLQSSGHREPETQTSQTALSATAASPAGCRAVPRGACAFPWTEDKVNSKANNALLLGVSDKTLRAGQDVQDCVELTFLQFYSETVESAAHRNPMIA